MAMAEDEDPNIISRLERTKPNPKEAGPNTDTDYIKYSVGGESEEVPASKLDENDNFIHRRERNQPKQKKNEKK